jgi:hypothetical protein
MAAGRKEQRRAACIREAHELAGSGKHLDYLTIEHELSGQYPEAREWLDNWSLREDLKAACDRARK